MPIKKTSGKRKSTFKLTAKQREVCNQYAKKRTGLATKRAKALLAIDGGATRSEVSKKTGLSLPQIQYLLTRFKAKKLAIFPAPAAKTAKKPVKKTRTVKAKPKPKAKPKTVAKKKPAKPRIIPQVIIEQSVEEDD